MVEISEKIEIITAGMVVCDIITADIDRFANQGEMMFIPDKIQVHVGGHPANVAIDLFQMGIPSESLGVISAIGSDIFGEFIENSLKEKGINAFLQITEKQTAKNIIFVIKNEDRRFHLDPGANLFLEPEFVIDKLKTYKPEYFCFRPGYSGMDTHISEILSAISGAIKIFDICRPYNKPWNYFFDSLEMIDIFHSNSHEAMNITGKTDIDSAVSSLLSAGVKIVTITDGEKGAILSTDKYHLYQPAYKIDAIDPTGAGDAFCSGLIKYMRDNKLTPDNMELSDLKNMLAYAQAAGACAASSVGTTSGVNSEKISELIKNMPVREKTDIQKRL